MSARGELAQRIALLSPAVGTGNIGDHFIEEAIRRILSEDVDYQRFTLRRALSPEEIAAINAADCALVCGTNLYQHDWEPALTPAALARLRVPVIPFGVGSSAARLEDRRVSAATGEMIRALHSRCAVGSVRDPHSLEVVAAQGVENVVLTGCPVLFWAGDDRLAPIPAVKRRRLVVTARNWLMHRWPDNVDHPTQIRFLRRLLESFPGDQLLFAMHEDFDASLVRRLGIPRRRVFQGERPEDYLRLYADQDAVVVALRLHAGMLALANGVPAVFVGHDTRSYSFCRMMGLECLDLFSEDGAEECIARLRRILDGDVSAFGGLSSRYEELRSALRGFLEANGLPVRCAPGAPGAASGVWRDARP